jgi:hypothetical protein
MYYKSKIITIYYIYYTSQLFNLFVINNLNKTIIF